MNCLDDEDAAIAVLAKLIEVDSINPIYGGKGEAQLVAYLESWLREKKVSYRKIPVMDGRENVVARVGPSDAPAVLLDAHMDTVGVEGWRRGDPFRLTSEGGRHYGRGACDTKASMAVFMRVLEHFASGEHPMRFAVVFAATVDEEDTQRGAYELAKVLPEWGVKWAISGEPTRSDVVSRHKGVGRYLLTTKGKAVHASVPEQGESAIYKAARICLEIEAMGERLRAAPAEEEIERGAVNVGVVRGGVGFNVVPDSCQLDVDRRFGAVEDPADARAELEAICSRYEGTSLEIALERPALRGRNSGALVGELLAAGQARGESIAEIVVPYMTNAVAYEEAGVPAVVFGPGDIAQAHKVDEYLEAGEMRRSLRVLEALFAK